MRLHNIRAAGGSGFGACCAEPRQLKSTAFLRAAQDDLRLGRSCRCRQLCRSLPWSQASGAGGREGRQWPVHMSTHVSTHLSTHLSTRTNVFTIVCTHVYTRCALIKWVYFPATLSLTAPPYEFHFVKGLLPAHLSAMRWLPLRWNDGMFDGVFDRIFDGHSSTVSTMPCTFAVGFH